MKISFFNKFSLSFFNKIKYWILSDASVLPLLILMYVSPLPPLSTLKFLRDRVSGFKWLPNPLKSKANGYYSKNFWDLMNTVVLSHKTGSKSILIEEVDRKLRGLEGELDILDYNLSQIYQFISIFTSIVPSIVVSTLIFVNFEISRYIALALALFSLGGGLLGYTIYPSELSLKSSLRILVFYIFVIPLYFVFKFFIKTPLMFSILICSIPSGIFSYLYLRKCLQEMDLTLDRLRKTVSAPLNVFKILNIKPSNLLESKGNILSKIVNASIYLIALHSEDKGAYIDLERLYTKYYETFRKIRSKTRIMFFYSVLEAAITTAIYVFIIVTLIFLSQYEVSTPVFMIPSEESLNQFIGILDIIFGLNALALSILTATVREGNALYFSLYLPFILVVMITSYYVFFTYTPLLFR